MKIKSIFLLALFSFLPAISVFAGEVTMPYPDFKPGSPAYANSIDANFEAIVIEVNNNAADIQKNAGNSAANSASITGVKSLLDSHGHEPSDIIPQGSGSDLDADMLDGRDSADFAASVHGHDSRYPLLGHTHPAREVTGSITADTLDTLDSSDFASSAHFHADYALDVHVHDTEYAPLSHTHEDYAAGVSDHEARIDMLEGYGDLSTVLETINTLHETVRELKSRITELEAELDKVSTNSTNP